MKNYKDYYLGIAKAVAQDSRCYLFKQGCVLVDFRGSVISVGSNGAADKTLSCFENGCCTYQKIEGDISNGTQDKCCGLHAELWTLLGVPKDKLVGSSLYIWAEKRNPEAPNISVEGVIAHMIQAAGIKDIIMEGNAT